MRYLIYLIHYDKYIAKSNTLGNCYVVVERISICCVFTRSYGFVTRHEKCPYKPINNKYFTELSVISYEYCAKSMYGRSRHCQYSLSLQRVKIYFTLVISYFWCVKCSFRIIFSIDPNIMSHSLCYIIFPIICGNKYMYVILRSDILNISQPHV